MTQSVGAPVAGVGVGMGNAGSPKPDTKELILDAAERLFAEKSYASVSLRELTAAAGVNLAAVNYHFGSKDALLIAVFRRGAVALNKERARLLRDAEERAGGGTPPLREIVEALVVPSIRYSFTSTRLALYNQFVAFARGDGPPEAREMLDKDVGHLQRFVLPLARALPHLPQQELYWRLHFMMGVQHSLYTDMKRLETLSGGQCHLDNLDAVAARVVDFVIAGLEAPYRAPGG
ncbi:TetR/AcrR family transcriptional regulator [Niveispirillum irakense]|uniref:TetR/AcrR family transcriptional regulator n=1 Tax=Niveispirillum irakense TaxID=34011 RepID=UPI00068490A2|nr:TetR/AcrR family transcriptional regulator [Niveispirillum irakense]